MVSQTNEKALEDLIENSLLNYASYQKGSSKNFDPQLAIDTEQFWQFLETTQPEELAKINDRTN